MSGSGNGFLSYAATASPRRTAHELVRDTLRQAIVSGEIERGSVLVQTEIASQLRVSTTPVREALRDLAAEGLIRLDAHKSAIVLPGSLNEMEEIYSLRLLLEPYCAKMAIGRITPAELDEAANLHERMVKTDHPDEWMSLNTAFHQILTDAAGLPRLAAFLRSLREAAQIYIGMRVHSVAEIGAGNADHAAILEAFRAHDIDAACGAILKHLEETRRQASEELTLISPVRSVRARLATTPIDPPVNTPNYHIDAVWNVLVEVIDDDGRAGAGYLWCFAEDEATMLLETVRVAAPVVVGADPSRPDEAARALRRRLNFFGFKGVSVFAMSVLDLALVDLDCRQRGVALSASLYGDAREAPRAYWSGLFLDTPISGLLDEIDKALAIGLRAVKLRVGKPELADDVTRLDAVRNHLPDDVVLMLDAVQRWAPDDAIEAAKAFAPYGPLWLEDPGVHSDYDGLARVVEGSPVAIASGDNEYLLEGFEQIMETGIPYLLGDLQRIGGITEWQRIEAKVLGATRRHDLTSHTYPHVAAHLCARQGGSWVEYVPWWDVLIDGDVAFDTGRIQPSTYPGTGIRWDEDAVGWLARTDWIGLASVDDV